MWRSIFIALGVFLCLLGAEFLACDHLVLRGTIREPERNSAMMTVGYPGAEQPAQRKIYVPKDWMPWTLLASGVVVLMYSVRPRV